ncbi:hypothetical protein SAMN02745216_02538 [Desulfatibacillum alkenivorans DSM 16219]|uniref:Queuine tRNA-ribosyltransferase n=1 Tax=Desulfatibacillum alkenivorans DSM 16219 TaxID=1121393 RepID=A0A1M6N774_9BACT|nr:hypothetical protein [Desulfatibacillum alkenivorans]SHJ91537.1 hypothetical protein SAMN02745216_02538 [Desulfatibacillum alkenivorans DSM 16219]
MNKRCKFWYLSVMNPTEGVAPDLTDQFMINQKYPFPRSREGALRKKQLVCSDSGGYQILKCLQNGGRVWVSPHLRPRKTKSHLILNPRDICLEYARTHTTVGFLLDYPTDEYDTKEDYIWKRDQSIKVRDMMLPLAEKICPNVELAIALQPRYGVIKDVEDYFPRIRHPRVRTYGFPIRGGGPQEIAYALSYLNSQGVRKVHLLGSSTAPHVMVLGQAAGMRMFKRITFDSTTYLQHFRAGLYKFGNKSFLDYHTMASRPRRDGELCKFRNSARLKPLLDYNDGKWETVLGEYDPPEEATVKDWIGFYNIQVIHQFAERMARYARKGILYDHVEGCWLDLEAKTKVLCALDMLHLAVEQGHDSVKEYYRRTTPPEVSTDD